MKSQAKKMMYGIAVVTLTSAFSAGCATTPADPGELVQPYRTVVRAEMEGASEHPEAQRHLERAHENGKMAAKSIIFEEDAEVTERFIDRAQADAQLALEVTRRENAEEDLSAVEASLELLEDLDEMQEAQANSPRKAFGESKVAGK